MVADGHSLRISVEDYGFASASRAAEENLTTVFTVGDKIGLYAVKDGAVVSGLENVCFQAIESADGIAWEAVGAATLEKTEGVTYFAYYPYTETLEGSVNCSAEDADGFFADVAGHWTVKENQSDYADYTASDLMTAKGVITDGALSFAMQHRMALVRVLFPAFKYVFTNTPAIPDYILGSSEDVKFAAGAPYAGANGEYRYIVNPAAGKVSLSGTYKWTGDNYRWDISSDVKGGAFNTINVDSDRSDVIEHNLQIGDFLLSDGTLLSKDAPAGDIQALDVVGIVYNIDPARIGDAEKTALGGVAHASVMATKDAYYPYPLTSWTTVNYDESEIGLPMVVGKTNVETVQMMEKEISGYETHNIVKSKRPEQYKNSEYEVFLLAELHCGDTGNIDLLKARTTGWYVPAAGQWLDIVRNLGKGACVADQVKGPADLVYWTNQGELLSNINSYMENIPETNCDLLNVNRYYWTATGATIEYAYYVNVSDGQKGINSYSCFANKKSSWNYLRPVLTF